MGKQLPGALGVNVHVCEGSRSEQVVRLAFDADVTVHRCYRLVLTHLQFGIC